MKNEKLTISAITDKLEIQDVEVQGDPCKDNRYMGVYDCLVDCPNRAPKGSSAY
ncbi:hypothetical protein QOZ83_16240 [Romboutsia sedimentorum]|uniref:hypothetical protein n=1 Tax=Romboutsia sedimentorum TaxID=1368474 RepID=UPI0024DEC37B|nr:hypothetical protein [Romboutsia sedimentorum]MDK2587395.1 hypothetical protein [Romboutsia sedimentorum]